MKEKKYLYFLIIFSIFTAISGIYFTKVRDFRILFSDLYVEKYSASFDIDKILTLNENFKFNVRNDSVYRMLYRNWKVHLVYKRELNSPYIEMLNLSGDGYRYIKDFQGNIYGDINNSNVRKLVARLAYDNEVGIVNPEYFKKGFYSLATFYNIFPPIERDDNNMHINLKLADKHIFYKNVFIKINDSRKIIEKIYPHLPRFSLTKFDNTYIINGYAPTNSIVEVEFLLKPSNINGFFRYVKNVKYKTEKANKNLFFYNNLLNFLQNGLIFLLILFPVFVLVIYQKFGSEKKFTVPQFLSFVPDKNLKPYIVNLVFNGDSFAADENAFYATLLDLKEKGKIDIQTVPDFTVKIKDVSTKDPYEKKILSFLTANGEKINEKEYIFKPEFIEYKIKTSDVSTLRHYKRIFDGILRYENPSISSKYVEKKGIGIFFSFIVIPVLALIFPFIFSFISGEKYSNLFDTTPIIFLSILLLLNFIVALFTPTQFFGRWKEDFYKSKLQWDAFRNFLSDMAMIKKYAPEDISIWKEWLIYGTALGVADKVEKAMKELNIEIPEIEEYRITKRRFSRTYSYVGERLSEETSSSSGGGGFGAGGGFGGGGAGGR